jgi:hypothetical protein
MSAQTFQCPNCGGRIPLTGGTEKSAKCPFCSSTVIIPKELRATGVQPQVMPQFVINASAPQISGDAVKKGALAIGGFTLASVLLPLIITCVVIVFVAGIIGYVMLETTSMVTSEFGDTGPIIGSTEISGLPFGPTTKPGIATVKLQFGSEGIGAGQFEDVRHIGLDAEGNIFVGQYIGGRVQVFDPQGKYQTEWQVDRKMPLRGFAVSRKGTVYVSQSGRIDLYDGQTGQIVGTRTYADGDGFDSLWLLPNETLVTSWYRNSDDLVVFDPQGNTKTVVRQAISTVTESSELDTKVAADGVGNIYAMGSFNNGVFKFSPDGSYLDKFGSDGDDPGQFRAMLAIAVDGQGRIYVADIKGVQIFSNDGQYIGVVDVEGAPYGITIDDGGNLWVAAGTQVIQYQLNLP